jgi:hypothetical protein
MMMMDGAVFGFCMRVCVRGAHALLSCRWCVALLLHFGQGVTLEE